MSKQTFYYTEKITVKVNPVHKKQGHFSASFYSYMLAATFVMYFEDSRPGADALTVFIEMLEQKFKTTIDILFENSRQIEFTDTAILEILMKHHKGRFF